MNESCSRWTKIESCWRKSGIFSCTHLLFLVHIGWDIVVLRIAFATCTRGPRCFSGFNPFHSAVAGDTVAPQALDILYFRVTDRAELREYVLPRATIENASLQPRGSFSL